MMLSTILKRGSTGPEVRQVQRLLSLAGSRPRLASDGQFGPTTERAVLDFQSRHGLRADGQVDSIMWSALQRATPESDPPAAQPATDGTTQEPDAKVRGYPGIKEFIPSTRHSSRDGAKPTKIVLHCTESSFKSALQELSGGPRRVSVHYLIDRNGDIYQLVPDDEIADHCMGANRDSIGIEHVGTESDELTASQAAASAALIRWLTTQHDIPLTSVFGHDFTPGYSRPGGTSCPDKLFGPVHAQSTIAAWVAKNVKG